MMIAVFIEGNKAEVLYNVYHGFKNDYIIISKM